MKLHYRLVMSIYASFIIFAWFSFYLGPDGLLETKRLEVYKTKLESGNARLEEINRKLENEFIRLESDPGIIALEARSLGYYHENEGVFILEGYHPEKKGYSIGSLLREYSGKTVSIDVIRYTAIASGIIIFLFLTIFTREKDGYPVRRKRYSRIYNS